MPSTGTFQELADYLVSGYWTPHSFDTSSSNRITVNIADLSADGQQLARWAMQAWEAVADIDFVETSRDAQITFSDRYQGAYSGSTYSRGAISSAYMNVAGSWVDRYGTTLDSYAFSTYMHELGHALGLGHLGEYDGNAVYPDDATFANDSWQISIMSYFDQTDNTATDASYAELLSPMMVDILAIQQIYGTPGADSVSAGDTVWGRGSSLGTYLDDYFALIVTNSTDADLYLGSPMAFTLYDMGGHDLIDLGFGVNPMRIDLRAGRFSDVAGGTGNIGVALGTVIEDLYTGAGDDTLTGNAAGNLILAGAGNDVLSGLNGADRLGGGAGNDTLNGGSGADTLWGADGNDRVFGGNGRDVVWLADGADLYTDTSQTGFWGGDAAHGGAGNDTLSGGSGADTLWGDGGNDLLQGGNEDDALHGGAGNDTVWGGNGRDRAWLHAGDDLFNDNAQTGDFASDTVYGGSGADTLNGGGGADRFYGGDGADVIAGGIGDDLLNGGRQNDLLYGGDGNDTVVGSNGADQAWLGNGNDYYEDDDQVAYGDDRIWGGNGNDTILMGGGDDTATGGAGADSFVIASVEGDDLVTDYQPGIDDLTFTEQIWNGGLTVAEMLDSFAEVTGGALVFSFEPGYSVTLAGITDIGSIADDITLV
ncbi:M10 family metallopeptidase C-terminal domain-containing protein [Citreicella sp. C3M06]|uniref:M10 family metallopeptidase n=1 Tax=Citreicella sp. C3M06 TaxID=2841564 RepID=UPI001C08A475|nr:M10 family metallopeptidase [Citreicella sp. C3M06]MBU2963500.1 M10 family metallopeptidase C-terminal domain-containing protein [Citreicella sp. C3M06]